MRLWFLLTCALAQKDENETSAPSGQKDSNRSVTEEDSVKNRSVESLESSKNKTCTGMYSDKSPVINLCKSNYPKKDSDEIYVIYYERRKKKNSLPFQKAFKELAEEMKSIPNVVFAGMNCTEGKNKKRCDKEGVPATSEVRLHHYGKTVRKWTQSKLLSKDVKKAVEEYQKKIGTKGGSSKCPKGVFTSTLKDSVVPLCAEHFPDDASKNPWVVVFYAQDFEEADKKEINRLALDLGNEPVDKSANLKKTLTHRKRLQRLKEKYELNIKIPKKGENETVEPLAKVGGVCCHCDDGKYQEFCETQVGNFTSQASLFRQGSNSAKLQGISAEELVAPILKHLGHIEEKDEL